MRPEWIGHLAEAWPQLAEGIVTTLWLTLATLVIATPLALSIAVLRVMRPGPVARTLGVLVNLVRILPAVLVLFVVFYLAPFYGIRLKPFAAALIALSVMGTAYMSEDIRGGIAAVDRGQIAAGRALGLSGRRILLRIVMPQALPMILPPYMSRAIIMMKATSLASMIAVNELTAQAVRETSITYRPFVYLLFAGAIYLAFAGVLALAQAAAERALARRFGRVSAPGRAMA